ncbi:MAG: hypothetical protein V3V01_03395 [Acidimicrobiales bacterium]
MLARIAFIALLVGKVFWPSPSGAQPTTTLEPSQDCPSVGELVSEANAIIVGEVIEVRRGEGSDRAEPSDVVVLRVVEIGKGGAQNPLAVYYPASETLPELEAGAELNVIVNYDSDGRATSTLACARTTGADGSPLTGPGGELGAIGESAGDTAQEALRAAALLGVGVIGATVLWRLFREFRPAMG